MSRQRDTDREKISFFPEERRDLRKVTAANFSLAEFCWGTGAVSGTRNGGGRLYRFLTVDKEVKRVNPNK